MLIQSRLGGLGAQWRQLSKIGKIVVISFAIFSLLAVLWGTGTVDVDYVRNHFKNTPDNPSNEPIPQEKNDTPIIDGVPNDQNDRPIPTGVIEEGGEKQQQQSAEKGGSQGTSEKQDPPASSEPDQINNTETTHEQQEQEAASASAATDGKPPIKTTAKFQKEEGDATPSAEVVEPVNTEPIAGGIPLRIMFIGASMTLGDPPQSAYRMQLREWLVGLGNPVNCVGTNRFGKFKDNDVQAFPATAIKQLHEKALEAVPAMSPNLIIVNAGSSDCFQEEAWGSAHGYDYTRDLVDFLFEASPRATVILSTLVTSTEPAFERCIKSLNAQIRQVALDVRREGKAILLSEQHYDQGLPDRVTPDRIKSDKMHPTFDGWAMMGEIYKRDIREADARGWIIAPLENGIMDDGDAERDLEEAEMKKVEEDKKIKVSEEEEKKKKKVKGDEGEKKKKTTTTTTTEGKKAHDGMKKRATPHARRLRRGYVE